MSKPIMEAPESPKAKVAEGKAVAGRRSPRTNRHRRRQPSRP
ncbi:hypothetical protein I546_5953 [Mycobacterium kansasii 732]|nr:hypothetical protein I546_5953 [Mycobacterium kansasii 732]